jgi:hypothetical protein
MLIFGKRDLQMQMDIYLDSSFRSLTIKVSIGGNCTCHEIQGRIPPSAWATCWGIYIILEP